ncbi:MAG: glycosyltransferase family 2 protein [Pirellulaceae bacterium]|nr:glycosyltransferase family 2 protein [Pirellulaceae bacterium]
MSELLEHPLVSIVIPSYNMERFVGEAIQSALDQTWPNTEILVSDDASPDQSWSVISKFPTEVVKFRHEKNIGFVANANDLFQRARGEYVCLLCSDDALEPAFITSAMALYQQRPDLGYVQVHYQPVDDAGRRLSELPPFYREAGIVPGMEETRINLLGCHTMLSQHVFSAGAIKKIGGFSTFSGMAYDYELALYLSMNFDVGYLPQPLVRYRYSELQQTAYNKKSMLTVLDQYRVRLQVLDRRLPKEHPIQSLRAKIIASAAKEALVYGRWAMDAGDYSTARKYLALMVAFDYTALEIPAFEEIFQALNVMLQKPGPQIAQAWADWKADEAGHTAQLHREKGGPPYPLPKGSIAFASK